MRLQAAVFVLPAIATLLLSIYFWQSMRGTDDLDYSRIAITLVRGDRGVPLFQTDHHHAGRLGTVLPLAAIFFVFGPSNVSLALFPLICTVVTASLVAWLGRRFWGGGVGLVAGLLYALIPLTIDLSTFYVPEAILSLELCLASSVFLLALKAQRQSAMLLQLSAGAIVGAAYLTTEVGALMLPVLYLYLLVGEGIRWRDGALLAGFVLVVLLELTYHWRMDGNALYRFTAAASYASDPMVQAANVNLSYRLLKAYPASLAYPNPDLGLSGPLLALGGLYGLSCFPKSMLFVFWAAAVLLFYNFMSASFTHYVALPVAMRLIAPACVPLAILTAKLLVDLWHWIGQPTLVMLRYALRAIYAAGAIIVAIASLLAMYLNTMPTLTGAAARNAESVARFLRGESAVTLVTDPRSALAVQFYRDFSPRDSFVGFAGASQLLSARPAPSGRTPAFLVLNGPIIHEKEITGTRFGASLSLNSEELEAVRSFAVTAGTELFAARPWSGRLSDYVLRSEAVRYLLGPGRYRLVGKVVADSELLAEVRVFRYSDARATVQ